MTPDERDIIKALGTALIQCFREQVIMDLLFATFVPLGIISLKTSVRTQVHRKTACLVLCGILSATCMVVVRSGIMIIFIRSGMIEDIDTPIAEKRISTNQGVDPWHVADSVLQLLPLLANDTLIIWHAWVIFSKRHWALYILAVFWLTTAGVIVASFITSKPLSNSLRYISFGLTLGTNIIATSFIGSTLWEYRKMFKTVGGKSKAWKVLVLLFEIGFIYCLLQVVTVISAPLFALDTPEIQKSSLQAAMQVPFNTCTMFSALYPIIVAIVIQGPSVMLGMHKTATSMHEQVNVNVI